MWPARRITTMATSTPSSLTNVTAAYESNTGETHNTTGIRHEWRFVATLARKCKTSSLTACSWICCNKKHIIIPLKMNEMKNAKPTQIISPCQVTSISVSFLFLQVWMIEYKDGRRKEQYKTVRLNPSDKQANPPRATPQKGEVYSGPKPARYLMCN